MPKTRKLTDADKAVTEGRLAVLLSRWAKAADAAMSTKLQAMREELRAEMRAEILSEMRAPHRFLPNSLLADAEANPEKYGIPTDSEGAE
jgi:hypothetical protein